ncbi:MAG: M23 family metallopeptidase [Campylobacterota bacterium]|nr:M23 family metallopeptidase [Campylobacterota bacterium]
MRYIVAFILFVSTLCAFNFEISNSTIKNGRTAMILFDKEEGVAYDKLLVGKRSYKIFNHPLNNEKMYALLPVSYYKKPTTEKVKVAYSKATKDLSKTLFFKIEDGKYQKEHIKVQKSKVNPKSEAVKKRTAKEYAQAMKIYGTVTPKNYVKSKYIVPMDSKITSSFGKARVYNDTLKGYHSGTDFRAKIGTPIVASNRGKVVLAQDRFYAGNSVIIDHGEGIYTCYYHLSEFKVKEGDMVEKAQVIGLSGDTGRITGPHLHFSVRVGGLQVDPLQLIALLNANLYKL